MKLQPDKYDVPSINGYGPGWIAIDGQKHHGSVVVSSQGEQFDWGATRFEDLNEGHFAQLAALDCEVVVFGSGLRNRFPPAAWLRPLMERRIGLETMDTQAACRTYNILAGEGRKVAAALLLEDAQAPSP
ncbi:Mth938-like domain-containing protein [Curvibacter sp. HBC61]|uniref:Mth938-like domain-containing protein n=1 Tax=Curvibacter cyanobacteriorum TaxID=3026422 RepID=A0ABT5MWW0_9BURK|nr:Mth938-like domain-containing protein [Curvibacter sp. HBC61]MDD0838542.1 Mth938-like domain-containing protein [Curvibacter sp. HBC61]